MTQSRDSKHLSSPLSRYPFDQQTCYINISIADHNFLQLVHRDPVTWLGERKAEEYMFSGTTVTNQTFYDGMVGICVMIKFKRKIIGAIMTIYIPSTLIVFVSYLTTIFNNKQWFGHIITINLTVRKPSAIKSPKLHFLAGDVGGDYHADQPGHCLAEIQDQVH